MQPRKQDKQYFVPVGLQEHNKNNAIEFATFLVLAAAISDDF